MSLDARFCPECGTAIERGRVDATAAESGADENASPGPAIAPPPPRPRKGGRPSRLHPHTRTLIVVVAVLATVVLAAAIADRVASPPRGTGNSSVNLQEPAAVDPVVAECQADLIWGVDQLIMYPDSGIRTITHEWGLNDGRRDLVLQLYAEFSRERTANGRQSATDHTLRLIDQHCGANL